MALSPAQNGRFVMGTVEAVSDRLAAMSIASASTSSSAAGGDSGYTSQTSTPDTLKVGTFSDGCAVGGVRYLWPRRVVKIKPFDKAIPQLTQIRFQDLREQYADTLNQFTRTLPNCRSSVMSLVVLGEIYEKAEPWVFIQCEKLIAKRVRSFFKQSFVKSDFEPKEPSPYSPRFQIYVCDLPPKRLTRNGTNTKPADRSATDAIEVYIKNIDTKERTLYGKQIKIFVKGTEHTATLGGLIEVVQNDGHREIMGLTAGHFLAPELHGDVVAEDDDKPEEDDNLDGFGDDTDDNFSDEGDIFVLDESAYEDGILPDHQSSSDEDENDPMSGWSRLGKVVNSSHDWLPDDGPNLDWALIAIDESLFLNDTIKHLLMLQPATTTHEISQRLVCINTPLVRKFGIVSNIWSYLILEPGRVFSKTYLVTISGNKVLQNGDSGSWVVDVESRKLYGHVVASNVFGQVYAVPIGDIFEDIRHRLSAQAVSLSIDPLSSRETHVAAKDPDTVLEISQGVPLSSSTSTDVPTILTTLNDETLPSPQSPQLGTPQVNSSPLQSASYVPSVPMPSKPLRGYYDSVLLSYRRHSTTDLQPGAFKSSQNPIASSTSESNYENDTDDNFSGIVGGHLFSSSSSNALNQVPQQYQPEQNLMIASLASVALPEGREKERDLNEIIQQHELDLKQRFAEFAAVQRAQFQAALMNYDPQASASRWVPPAPSSYIRDLDSGYSSQQVSPTPTAANSSSNSPASTLMRRPREGQLGDSHIQGFLTGTPPQ